MSPAVAPAPEVIVLVGYDHTVPAIPDIEVVVTPTGLVTESTVPPVIVLEATDHTVLAIPDIEVVETSTG